MITYKTTRISANKVSLHHYVAVLIKLKSIVNDPSKLESKQKECL